MEALYVDEAPDSRFRIRLGLGSKVCQLGLKVAGSRSQEGLIGGSGNVTISSA